jgi:arabinose-5-phosphate isomerase
MHPKPLTISRDELAAAALRMMEEKKVTSLLVASREGFLEGVIHIHDLWQTQMF